MKKASLAILGLSVVFVSTGVLTKPSHQASLIPLSSFKQTRSIAQAAAPTFEEIRSYYLQNVNPNGIIVASSEELAREIVKDHLRSSVARGGLVLMNNLGPSDSEFADKEGIDKLAKQEVIELAIEMQKKAGGGTIAVAAGNTNTGVGRIVTAVQDPEFVKHLRTQYNVRVTTWGVSSAQAALNHGPYEANKFGTDFMNTHLTGTVQVPTDGWTVKVGGISQVVTLNTEFFAEAKKAGIGFTKNLFMVREGGPIAIEESTQLLLELERIAKESGIAPKGIATMVIQQGHKSGQAINEMAADKGTRAATDLLVSLFQVAKLSAESKATLESMGIQLQNIGKDGGVSFKGELNFETLQKTVAAFLSTAEGNKLLSDAKAYRSKIAFAADVAEVESKMGILNANELKALRNELKALSKDFVKQPEYWEKMAKFKEHNSLVRIKSFANGFPTYLQALVDVGNAYAARAKTASGVSGETLARMSASLKSIVTQAISRDTRESLELREGKIVRSIESDAARAVKKAVKR